MGAENGYSFKETLSKSFGLSDKLRMSGCLGEKTDTESKNKANESVRGLLETSFVGKYDSVENMLLIEHTNATDEAKKNTTNALQQIGLALSQNNEILKAAVEGIDELHKNIPTRLHGIQPFILSVALTNGKDDVEGHDRVTKLVELFKSKKKYETTGSEKDRTTFELKADDFSDELYDRYENASEKDNTDGTIGRVELTLGWTRRMRESLKKEEVSSAKLVSTDEDESHPPEEPIEGWKEDLGYQQAEDRVLQAKHEAALDAGEKNDYRSPVWLLTYQDMVDEEMKQRGKQQVRMDPPYPEWYKKLPRRERDLRQVRAKLLNGVAWKQMIRNKDVDKLMSNEAIDINKHELKLLIEMPHVEDAMRLMFSELFEVSDKPGDSKNFLRIKRDKKRDGTSGRDLDPVVENLLVHFQDYKEKLALRMQFPKEIGESDLDYEKRIDGLYNDDNFIDGQEVEKIEKNKKGQELTRLVWEGGNKTKEGMDFRAAVAVAWEFLYIGNLLESADEDRLLKPSEPISDKLRTMMYPLAKAMGKWGMYKGDKEGHKGVYEEGEKRGKYDKVTGEEEPMGGPIAAWVLYHLEMDEVERRKYENSFRRKLLNRESGYRPLPTRMAASSVEMLEVYCEDENHNLVVGVDGKPKTLFLSEALMDKKHKITFDVVKLKEREILKNGNEGDNIIMTKTKAEQEGREILGHEYDGHEHDIFVPFRDCMDGCKTAFDYLTGSGRIKFDSKDPSVWSLAFMKDIDLIRQNGVKYDKDGKKDYLRFVDNPEFLAWVIAASVGFDHRSEKIKIITHEKSNRAYYYAVKQKVDLPGLVKFGVNKESIMEYLSAIGGPYRTESYLNSLDRTVRQNEKERKMKDRDFPDTSEENY